MRRANYVHHDPRWGGSEKEDGSDGFQKYENGAATHHYVYYTIEALYRLGRKAEADAILFPMMQAFERGAFHGFGPNGRSLDWKAWDGTPSGYEGFQTDGYPTLLAVLDRFGVKTH